VTVARNLSSLRKSRSSIKKRALTTSPRDADPVDKKEKLRGALTAGAEERRTQ
jgi:hypothetical protein